MATHDARVVVVGGGPHALTVCSLLASHGIGAGGDVVVVEPSGRFMSAWDDAFARLEIPHLRSPSVHHPHPNPYELADFASSAGRSEELHGHYRLPGRELFADFCRELVDDWDLARWVRADTAVDIDPCGVVSLGSGETLRAPHIVIAHNPRRAVRPPGLGHHVETLHAEDLDLRERKPSGPVVVVGGGLTAAQLAVGACSGDCEVVLVHRRPLVQREFDVDPGWLGPKEMTGFTAEPDPARRLAMAQRARGGGSVPAWMLDRLGELAGEGRIRMVCGEVHQDQQARVEVTPWGGAPSAVEAGEVWLGTGWSTDVCDDHLLGPVVEGLKRRSQRLPVCVGGLPVTDSFLRLPGTALVVGGRLATLRLGPSAGNLSGARHLAQCVLSLVGTSA